MFDTAVAQSLKNLPNIAMPSCLRDITLMDYQIQGIKWLVKKETDPSSAPFYKKVKEKKQTMYLCEITQSSQAQPPEPICGSILCDEMGLGKSIQTIGLILLAPPAGVEYRVPEVASAEAAAAARSPVPANGGAKKRCTLIVCPVSVMSNWTDQISTYVAPGVLSVELYHGQNRQAVLSQVQAGNVDVLLVSYHTLGADYEASGKGGAPKKKKARQETIFDIDFHRIGKSVVHSF